MKQQSNTLSHIKNNSILHAIQNASNGIIWFFLTERNGKIQLTIAGIAIAIGVILKIPISHLCLVLLCSGLVMSLEIINTAIEKFCNDYHPAYKQSIGFIKDTSAGAVLLASICSVIIGLLIYIPAILNIIQ